MAQEFLASHTSRRSGFLPASRRGKLQERRAWAKNSNSRLEWAPCRRTVPFVLPAPLIRLCHLLPRRGEGHGAERSRSGPLPSVGEGARRAGEGGGQSATGAGTRYLDGLL